MCQWFKTSSVCSLSIMPIHSVVLGHVSLICIGGEPDPPRTIPSGVGKFKILGVSLRYFGPKQRHSMPTRSHGYTDWFTVDAVPGAPDICFASLLYYYVRASELLPAGMHDDALFCSQNKHKTHGSQHFGLQSSSLATLVGKMMEAAGIPADFLPHSARAAGMAAGKKKGMADEDVCVRSNVSRPTYKKFYERQIRKVVYQPPSRIT